MGFRFLLLIISLVTLSRAKDLRPPASQAVDRRSAPDALLGEIFNDPSATSLTKLNLEDSDNDNDDFSGSGSELWSGSGELPKPSGDTTTLNQTDSQHEQATETLSQTLATSDATGTEKSNNSNDTTDIKDNNNSTDTSTATSDDSDDTNTVNPSTAAQTAPTQSSTDASLTSPNVTSQGADAKLPSTEDQSQNTVVQTEENDKTSNDKSNTAFLPAQTQSTLETVPDYSPAALVGQQSPGFDDNSLYDPTIVKKTDVPVGPDMFSNPLVNNTADLQGTLRSAIPQAPVPAPQAPAIRKSAVPFRGSFPLQLHKYSPYSKLMKKNMIEKAKAGLNQNAGRKSVIPGLTEAGGLRPLSINLPQGQQQQDATNNQGYPQPQMQGPAMDVNPAQMTFGDQPQASPTAQPFAPVPTKVQPLADQAPAESPLQNPQQVLDQAQGGVPQAPEQAFAPQAPEQAFAPQVADPSNMQMQSPENVAAAFPINTTMPDTMVGALPQQTPGIPAQGVQAVPVYQGLQPKKPVIEEEDCDDQFDTCPEMAKNDYCTKYPDLMKIQCKKSCHFCEIKHNNEESGSGYDEYDSGSASLYYADEVNSGSGSSDWDDDSDDDEDPGYRKSGIPAPIHKVLMAKFAADSGSASGASGMGESSASDEDIIQTSGSGEAGSGSQKKDEVSEAASGSGEALPVTVASPTPGTTEIGSGSGSLAEDLATGTVSRANEKHSSIPRPPAPQVSVYPKIDLKEIAKAVNMYRGVALKMLGEALEGAAEQKEEELSKKSHIPLPPATDILQRMGFPIGYDESSKRNMVPNPMQDTNMMMAPNYGMMGYGNNGYAYNFPQQVGNEPLADFYAQYQQQPNFARSGIMASPEEQAEEQQSEDEGAAQADQSEAIQPENDQQQENTTGAEVQDKPETPKNNTDEKDKKDKIVDPFEYVRNMGKGASMEPIRSKAASGLISASHSDPLILWKSSQIQKLAALAKKKSEIPQPGSQTLMPAVSDSQFEQEVLQSPEQQFRSDIPEQNITMGGLPDMSGQTASVFPQSIPQSEALPQSPADELAARSQILQGQALPSLEQPQQQGEQESSLRELRSYFPEDE